MSTARVVYHGAGGGGDLFAGMKFYLMQRIPTRETWKNLIKSNGGALVLLEAQADIIIGDHARKNEPAGSVSWTWIEASVRDGKLADIEDHRAGPTTKPIREVGSTLPTKKSRTAFTEEDDRILMEWCTRAERKGLSLAGNVLFQDLEEKNSRHTFQSWRDRWLKHLAHRPRPQLPDDEEERPAGDGPQIRPPQRRTTSRAVPSRPKSPPASSKFKDTAKPSAPRPPPPRPSHPPSSAASCGSDVFTDDETQELMDAYEDVMNISEDKIIDAWIAWAEEHPAHTAQQWRNYFAEYVAPKMKKGKAKEKITERHAEMPSPKKKHVKESAPKASSSKHVKIQIQDSQDIPIPHAEVEGFAFPSTKDESLFKEHLSDLAEKLELDVDFNPIVCGRPISLFRLWQVVESEEFGGVDEVDGKQLWPKVAARMNFPNDRQVVLHAAKELREVFNEILADLEDLTKRLMEELEISETEEQALLEAQLQETAKDENPHQNGKKEFFENEQEEEQEHNNDLDYPKFSPQLLSASGPGKRNSNVDNANQALRSNKRQRIDKGKGKDREIPSTPEEGINTTQFFPQSHQPTPTPLKKSSPLKKSWVHEEEQAMSEESDEEVGFASPSTHPRPKARRSPPMRNLEPETQDFHFPDLDPEPGDHFNDLSSSPSLPPLEEALHRIKSQTSNAATRGSIHSSNKEDSPTQSQTDTEKQDALRNFIDESVGLGYPQDIVVEALVSTTLEIGPHTRRVMECMMADEPIPDNESGVWTSQDDKALNLRVENPEYRRVLAKHGTQRVKQRKEYLAERESWSEHGEGSEG